MAQSDTAIGTGFVAMYHLTPSVQGGVVRLSIRVKKVLKGVTFVLMNDVKSSLERWVTSPGLAIEPTLAASLSIGGVLLEGSRASKNARTAVSLEAVSILLVSIW